MNAHAQGFHLPEDALDDVALALMAAMEAKATHLRRRDGAAERWSLAKSIAGAALALQLGRGCPPDAALAAATRAAGWVHRLGRAALKTRGSEARALLAYGLPASRRDGLEAARPDDRIDGIVAALLRLSLREALARRADALAGSRGGRPSESSALSEVKALIRRDQAGDPAARVQLVALSLQLRQWTDRIVQRAAITP